MTAAHNVMPRAECMPCKRHANLLQFGRVRRVDAERFALSKSFRILPTQDVEFDSTVSLYNFNEAGIWLTGA
jgi:hypothetical protein